MSDVDRNDPLAQLRSLAESGSRRAAPLPSARVREMGARRHRRRIVATVVAASLAVVVAAGGALAAADQLVGAQRPQPSTPSEAETPNEPEPPESAPPSAPTLTQADLVLADQLGQYFDRGWAVVDTQEGVGAGVVSVCQRGGLDTLGDPIAAWRRDFVWRGDGELTIRSAALEFADEVAAGAAYQTLRSWIDSCRSAVLDRGFDRFESAGTWYDVDVADGEGSFYAPYLYGPVPDLPDYGYWDSQGVVLVGNRVLLVSMVDPNTEFHVSYDDNDDTGLPLHPFIDALPAAATQLAE